MGLGAIFQDLTVRLHAPLLAGNLICLICRWGEVTASIQRERQDQMSGKGLRHHILLLSRTRTSYECSHPRECDISVIALRSAFFGSPYAGEESEDCAGHYPGNKMSMKSSFEELGDWSLQAENAAGIVSNFSIIERSAAVAFCER